MRCLVLTQHTHSLSPVTRPDHFEPQNFLGLQGPELISTDRRSARLVGSALFQPVQAFVISPPVPLVWGGVTDPNHHDPAHFRYLVYALNPSLYFIPLEAYRAKTSGNKLPPDPEQRGDQSINLVQQPERLAGRVSLSLSLTDPDHTETWGAAGLIVESPEDNVIITSPRDEVVRGDDVARLKQQATELGPVVNGDVLLARSNPYLYNEVVALATRDGNPVKLVGFFYKVTEEGEPLDKGLTDVVRAHALRLGLPLVPIVHKEV